MTIGTKIRKLREEQRMTQPDLAQRLGIAQATLCSIESEETKKIDFLLMDKICKEFGVDFEYFIEENQVNNVKENQGGVVGYNNGTIVNFPENYSNNMKNASKN